jgi:hypothetical protein
MQYDDDSPSPPQISVSLPPTLAPAVESFSFTKDDANILREYLDDFKDGDVDLRRTIIANAMAEIAMLRPDDEPFDKADVTTVAIHVAMHIAAHC